MNKLDKNLYDNIKEDYSKLLIPCIINNYNSFKKKNSTLYMNNSFDLKEIFESKGKIDNEKIKNLLISQFTDMDSNVINYIKTTLFIYFIKPTNGYKLKDLKEYFNIQDKQEIIENYFKEFMNPIIASYRKPHKKYETMKDLKELASNIDNDLRKLNADINLIINYNLIYNNNMRDQIMLTANIDICPYCGRQFITRFNDRSSADLDHFYPKKYFPLLSLSLYNFIPSCQICNSRFKNQHIKRILYPFNNGYEDNAKFGIKFNSPITDIYPSVKIQIKNVSKDKHFETEEDLKLFHIEEVYQSHNEFISNLIARKRIYDNANFRDSITKLVSYKMEDEEINDLLFGYSFNLEYDQKKPLAKLVKDIFNTSK